MYKQRKQPASLYSIIFTNLRFYEEDINVLVLDVTHMTPMMSHL